MKKTYEMKYSPGKPSPELITDKNSICKKKKKFKFYKIFYALFRNDNNYNVVNFIFIFYFPQI